MNEQLIQYLWNFKIFQGFNFKDTEGRNLEVLDFGRWNHDSGPDFLMGKIKTQNITLVGNIEIHLKASDWIFHQHTKDQAFKNIILHVVLQNDVELPEFKERNIPTLELEPYVDKNVLWKYENLMKGSQFIACEKIFDPQKIPLQFAEETLLKKLDEKSIEIEKALEQTKNNYEEVLFRSLAYAFGLKVNAPIFKQLAESLDFSLIQKIRKNQTQLEALFYGRAGWLTQGFTDDAMIWKQEFDYLTKKFQLPELTFLPKFMRLRPTNFPTIRLSQLAHLYFREAHLFSNIIQAKNLREIEVLFEGIQASAYWNAHFNFEKISSITQEKILTKEFIQLLIINAILPIKYTYHKNNRLYIAEEILEFYKKLPPEKNLIISQWRELGVPIQSALDSQAFLYQHKTFCIPKKCLNCSIGLQIMKPS